MEPKLKITISSHVDYEKLIAGIHCDGKFVALLTQEEGPSLLKLEFPGPDRNEEEITRTVDLLWFQHALEEARKKLLDETPS